MILGIYSASQRCHSREWIVRKNNRKKKVTKVKTGCLGDPGSSTSSYPWPCCNLAGEEEREGVGMASTGGVVHMNCNLIWGSIKWLGYCGGAYLFMLQV